MGPSPVVRKCNDVPESAGGKRIKCWVVKGSGVTTVQFERREREREKARISEENGKCSTSLGADETRLAQGGTSNAYAPAFSSEGR